MRRGCGWRSPRPRRRRSRNKGEGPPGRSLSDRPGGPPDRSPDGIRTRATALRGRRARPLHNGAVHATMRLYLRSDRGDRRCAGVPGLEPRLAEPESAGLPITPYPMGARTADASRDETTATGRCRSGLAGDAPETGSARLRRRRGSAPARPDPARATVPAEQLHRLEQRRGHPSTGHRDPDRPERVLGLEPQLLDEGRAQRGLDARRSARLRRARRAPSRPPRATVRPSPSSDLAAASSVDREVGVGHEQEPEHVHGLGQPDHPLLDQRRRRREQALLARRSAGRRPARRWRNGVIRPREVLRRQPRILSPLIASSFFRSKRAALRLTRSRVERLDHLGQVNSSRSPSPSDQPSSAR